MTIRIFFILFSLTENAPQTLCVDMGRVNAGENIILKTDEMSVYEKYIKKMFFRWVQVNIKKTLFLDDWGSAGENII